MFKASLNVLLFSLECFVFKGAQKLLLHVQSRIFAHPNDSLREQISVHPNDTPHEQIMLDHRANAVNEACFGISNRLGYGAHS